MLQVEGSSWCGLSIWPLQEQHIPLEMGEDGGGDEGGEKGGEKGVREGSRG